MSTLFLQTHGDHDCVDVEEVLAYLRAMANIHATAAQCADGLAFGVMVARERRDGWKPAPEGVV